MISPLQVASDMVSGVCGNLPRPDKLTESKLHVFYYQHLETAGQTQTMTDTTEEERRLEETTIQSEVKERG